MLELRPHCEACSRPLPPEARDAMICTYECTFCEVCALTRLANICPNCGGNFAPRPIRTRAQLQRHPASTQTRPAQVDEEGHARFFQAYSKLAPHER
ncbi:MAG TPA: DUF1272 domain-containing protein [Burkholderiaceae bacterium]|jgi:hypothetical protein|nr:DUF1272 domain-containing protein [Burkholderiaceae bacterium]